MRRIKYAPIPVKALLKQLKDTSCLMVDLALSAVIHGDEELAREVLELEESVDELHMVLTRQAALATRGVEDAERMVSVFKLASASNDISDAAAEIAKVALSRVKIPREATLSMERTDEVLARASIREESATTIAELLDKAGTVVNVVAVRRGKEVIIDPKPSFKLATGDVILVKGNPDSVIGLLAQLGYKPVHHIAGIDVYGEVIDMLAILKNATTLMIDLAFTALLTKSKVLAENVFELEKHVDSLVEEFQRRIVRLEVLDPDQRVGMIVIGYAIEEIADAADKIIDPLMAGLEPHPIIAEVLDETSERISVIEMDESDEGLTLAGLGYLKRGLRVLAVRRGGQWIIEPPQSAFRVRKGDVLIVKYAAEAEEVVEALEREEDREEIIEDIREEEWELKKDRD